MKILILDGQGGGVGHNILEALAAAKFDLENVVVVGTNAVATANMIKGYNVKAASGEQAAIFNSNRVDVIIGPVGIVMPNAMLGEITPAMAEAVSSCPGKIVLIPMNKCHATIVGIANKKRQELIAEAITEVLA